MHAKKPWHDIGTKCKTNTSIIFTPVLKLIIVLIIRRQLCLLININLCYSWGRQLTFTSLSGSLHNRSHNKPVSGTSVGRTIRRICSMSCKSGLSPPWQQNIFSSIIAAMGRQLKQSVNVFHNLILYLRLHSSKNPAKEGSDKMKLKAVQNIVQCQWHNGFTINSIDAGALMITTQ